MATAKLHGVQSKERYNFVKIYLFIFIVLNNTDCFYCADCIIDGYNVTQLSAFNPWVIGSDDGNFTFKIYLCSINNNDNKCPQNTAICRINHHNDSHISVGNQTENLDTRTNSSESELTVIYHGSSCLQSPTEFYSAMIHFRCGKHLGSPEYLGSMGCAVFFQWESIAFCTDLKEINEVPCYMYLKGIKYDLSPLIKPIGGYLVDSSNDREFYINVCRDISGTASSLSKCPANSAACRVINGKAQDMGQLAGHLQVTTDGNLMIQYTTSSKPDTCLDNPTTTITFICPERGGSKDPLLLDDHNCQYTVEWYTEYACDISILSSKTCQLNNEEHNIDIDLSPLTSKTAYTVSVTDGNDHYVYYIRVCQELTIPCSKKAHASVCQLKTEDSSFARQLGTKDDMLLRYSDGDLTLTYRNGDTCHTHFHRETIILFKCNKSAEDDGKGKPVFSGQENCTYFFEWQTKYACVEHSVDDLCQVDHKGHRYDLSTLVRKSGSNWVALDGTRQDEKKQYFINVCHDVLKTGDASGCPANSAICVKDEKGVNNIGTFSEKLTYDTKSQNLKLKYTGGVACGKGKTSSVINFICRPGDLESGPVLVQKTNDNCMYEFEWYTAAACVQSQKNGSDCRVSDDEAGYQFDLSRLTKNAGEYYTVHDQNATYDYFLNVCGQVTKTRCDNGHVPTASCQVKKNGRDSDVFSTGRPNGILQYYNGEIRLTYKHGDKYNDEYHTERQTEIVFLCDLRKGAGHPQLIEEKNHVYMFKWYTGYVCPQQPVECVFIDKVNNKQYDLSRLSLIESQENWEVIDDSNPSEKHKFYISVCRSLSYIHLASQHTIVCDPSAAVCETKFQNGKEVLVHDNLGQVLSGPVADGNKPGQLMLEYSNGENCTNINGKASKIKTTIHFTCSKGKVSSGPMPPQKINDCEYSFIWETEAACPIDDIQNSSASCSIKDPNSDFIFNLMPLKKKDFYKVVTSDNRVLRINICGPVRSPSCDSYTDKSQPGVCEHQPNRNPPLARVSKAVEYSDDGQLLVTYRGDRNMTTGQYIFELQISFTCERNVNNESLQFDEKMEQKYILRMATPLACPAQPVDCTVTDTKGQLYDLTPLARTDSNWEVPDARESHVNLKYILNVCRPVVLTGAGAECPGGPVGGCQIGGNSPFNIGYLQSKPSVAVDGTITLRYRGGDVCHKGTSLEAARSTRINFICSSSEHEPVFMGETELCEYVFDWETPSACPLQRVVGGGHCKVRDPIYHYEFDLSPLHKISEDYSVSAGEYKYLLNICGPLKSTLRDCTGMGACQTKPLDNNFHMNIGKSTDKLVYDAGVITLTYTEGQSKCHNKYNRTTVITFICDHSSDGRSGPRFLNEGSDCTYEFEWPTSHACPPYKVSDCSIIDKDGHQYDLSQLTRTSDNYEYPIEHDHTKFIINVCRSLVHHKDQTCPFNAAACKIDLNERNFTKRYHNIGELSEHPVKIENGKIVLKYENGETCSDGKKKATTTIVMICNMNGIDTHPVAHFAVGDCEHHFMWNTRAACPVSSQTIESGNCTVSNPATGYSFDLNILKKDESYVAQSPHGYNYTINVCAPVKHSHCGPKSGSCQHEPTGELRYFNAGNFTSNLQFKEGILMLNYSGGDRCHHNNFERTSIISFICKEGAGHGSPVYIADSDGCLYYFNWHTDLACEKQIKCSVDVGSNYTVDLSPLIKQSGHHLAVDMTLTSTKPKSLFYINICRPLNSIQGILCPAGSSACMVRDELPPKSLGKISGEPIVGPLPGQVTLIYDHGDKCVKHPDKNMTSRIVFKCKTGSQGTPELDAVIEDCEYVFSWETDIVCHGNTKEKVSNSCNYTNPVTKISYDLSSLNNPIEVSHSSGVKYYIQVCGGLDDSVHAGCAGSTVCVINGTKTTLYGKSDQRLFQMSLDDALKLTLNSNKKCKFSESGFAKVNILFECDESSDKDKPILFEGPPCITQFYWKTNLVCRPKPDNCYVTHGGVKIDLEILSREKGSWNHTDSNGNIYWINICEGLHGKALEEGCPAHASVCRKSLHRPSIDMLGRLDSQKLYMDSDGKTIVLEYSEGAPACSRDHRRSVNPQAKTIIKFKCAQTIGGPVFIPKPENEVVCVFEFEWKTRIACASESLAMAVNDVNGIITDPKSGGIIDLHKFSNTNGNHFTLEREGSNVFLYAISLDGHLLVDKATPSSRVCSESAVCQEKQNDNSYHRNIGSYQSRKYFIKDDILEVKYTSPQQCTDKNGNKNVTSTIIFHCQPRLAVSEPELIFKSHDCFFMFHWHSQYACISTPAVKVEPALPSNKNEGGNNLSSTTSGGTRKKTIAAVVGVFATVIAVCFGLVYFHKQERRIAFISKVKRFFRCNRQTERPFHYSVLAQADEDPEVTDYFTNDVTYLENGIMNSQTQLKSYHDDSDEDLLE